MPWLQPSPFFTPSLYPSLLPTSSMTKKLGKYSFLIVGQNLPFQILPIVSHPLVMKHYEVSGSSWVLEGFYQVLTETSSSLGQINPVPMASPH